MTPNQIIELFQRVGVRAGYEQHPAWDAFLQKMASRQYGADPATQAWFWFRDGWSAADAQLEAETALAPDPRQLKL